MKMTLQKKYAFKMPYGFHTCVIRDFLPADIHFITGLKLYHTYFTVNYYG
jgi:hypothetical protein